MYKAVITFFAVDLCMNLMAQSPINKNTDFGFLKDLHFRNGVDIVIIKAVYLDMTELIQGGKVMKTLMQKKKIFKDNFTYQIGFRPISCSEVFYSPSNANSPALIQKSLVQLYFTCVFFERREWEDKGVPFFLIIKADKVK